MKKPPIRVFSGGDAKYFPLIEDMVASVREFATAQEVGISLIDGGLEPAQAEHLAKRYGADIIEGGWGFEEAKAKSGGKKWLKTATMRSHLDQYAEGADIVAWIDGDAWVQDWIGPKLLFEAAAMKRLAIISQTSRYAGQTMRVQWLGPIPDVARVRSILYKNARNAHFPEKVARAIGTKPTLNGGIYAMATDAPHWEVWRRRQLEAIRGGCNVFSSDQLSIGLMVHYDGLPAELCPEICNYMGPWKASDDGKSLVEYYTPYAKVGIVHMAGQDAMRAGLHVTAPIATITGETIHRSLRRPAWRA